MFYYDPISCEDGDMRRIVKFDPEFLEVAGDIPEELLVLESLQELLLSRSWLTGMLSSRISSLTNLKAFAISPTGSVPSEIGLLTLLALDVKFRGAIPTELGNLVWLEKLLLQLETNNGIFPSELRRLTRLDFLSVRGKSSCGWFEDSMWTSLDNLRIENTLLEGSPPPREPLSTEPSTGKAF